VTDWGNPGVAGYVYKFTPGGVRSTFADLGAPLGLAFDNSGNLFVMDEDSGNIYKFTPGGVRTIFAKIPGLVLDQTGFLAFQPNE
jgi:sugar lactone lactonase YvrE